MADFLEDIHLRKYHYKLINKHYWFVLFSKQIMLAGYFVVIAVHVSTSYLLISSGGFLASISSLVMVINGLLGSIFFIWNRNYGKRLRGIIEMGQNCENGFVDELQCRLINNLAEIGTHNVYKTASTILIIIVSLGSIMASLALFVLFSLPYIKNNL